jgi:cytochrome c-type biogenesis protein CcmH
MLRRRVAIHAHRLGGGGIAAVGLGIGRSGIAAIAAVAIACGAIGYRIYTDRAHDQPPTTAPPSGSLEALQQRAQASPKDAGAWQKLGFAQFDQQHFDAAVSAYERATQLSPQNAVLWSSLGEARVMASARDPMPPAALDAFRKSISLDPKDPRARYFLAVEKDLKGDHQGAVNDWLALLKDTPAGAPWDSDLQRTIEQVGKIDKIDVAPRIVAATAGRPKDSSTTTATMSIPGPSQQQLAAASSLPPGAQQSMAEGMVERLAQKLKADPSNVDGWIMLMRTSRTRGRAGEAKAARASALAANPSRADELRSAAASLGVSL